MSKTNIAKNFAYNIMYQILSIVVPLITSPYLARVLGVEKIGINSWTYSIVFYFMILSILGVSNYGNRTIASVRESKEKLSQSFCSIYVCQLFMSIIMVVFYIFYVAFFAEKYKIIALLQVFFILANTVDITWFFYGMENFKVTVRRNMLVKIGSLVFIFLCVKSPDDLWKYTLINSGSMFIGQLMIWPYILKEVKIKCPSLCEIKTHIKPIIILFVPILAISIFANMDKYMIGKFSDIVQSGYYENADKIIGIPKAVITALGTVMLPRTAYLIANGQEEKSEIYIENTMLFTIIMASAFVFGMAAVSDIFSVWFWGEEFEECGELISYMSPAIIFSVFGNVIRTQYLIPRSKDKEYTISLIIGAIINFLVNIFTIPKIGALGAVLGTVISEFIMTALQSLFVAKELPIKKYIKEGFIFIIIGFAMFLEIILIKNIILGFKFRLLILILVGASTYITLLLLYFKLSTKDSIIKIRIIIESKLSKNNLESERYQE